MEPIPAWATDALAQVYDPCCREKGLSVLDMGLLHAVTVTGRRGRVELLLTSGWCPFAAQVLTEVERAVVATGEVDACDVVIVWDEPWTTDRLSPAADRALRLLPDPRSVPDRDAHIRGVREATR